MTWSRCGRGSGVSGRGTRGWFSHQPARVSGDATTETLNVKTHLVAHKLADFARPGVSDGQDLYQLRFLDILDAISRKARGDIDAPVGAQPDERLNGNDGAAPDKGPFLRTDVLLIQFVAEIVAEEDGPGDGKRPDISVQIRRQRA